MASPSNQTIANIALYLVPMILSLSVHEFAHAWVATRLGDDTPAREERLTLSPLAHIDPFGTLLVPLLSILTTGVAYIGWAKPVNVNPARFRRGVTQRGGMALSSAAGPLSNLLLVVLAVALLALLRRYGLLDGTTPLRQAGGSLLRALAFENLGLCVFNFLPIPPLDGSRLLPRRFDDVVERVRPYSFLLIAALMISPLGGALLGWPLGVLGGVIRSLDGPGYGP